MPLPPQALLVLPPACRQSGSHQDPTTLSTCDSLASPTNLWAPQVRTRLSIVVCSLLNKSWYQATTTLSELSTPQPLGDDPLASLCFLNRSSLVLDFWYQTMHVLLGSEPWSLICVWGIPEQPVPSQNQSMLKNSRPLDLVFFVCLFVFPASFMRTIPSNTSPFSILGCLDPNTP